MTHTDDKWCKDLFCRKCYTADAWQKAEVSALQNDNLLLETRFVATSEELEWLRTRVKELKEDAERYRWLRYGDNDEKVMGWIEKSATAYLFRNEKLDKAIDAAIAAQKEE